MQTTRTPVAKTVPGSTVYTPMMLFVYDFTVLWFNNNFVYRCPTHRLIDYYNAHISNHHLDVGVGTGYYLDKCKFPTNNPTIDLADINPNSLQWTTSRLRRYAPTAHLVNILSPIELTDKFDSIALNYVLHCLPGKSLFDKEIVFQNLKSLLNSGGVLFGSTILGQGVPHNFLTKWSLKVYNAKRVFSNTGDSFADLQAILGRHFRKYDTRLNGCVAFFAAWI